MAVQDDGSGLLADLEDDFSDDLMPSDGENFDEPEDDRDPEEVEAEQEEADDRKLIRGNPALTTSVLNWFEEEIKGMDSIETAIVISSERKVSLETALHAMNIVHDLLKTKQTELQNLKDTHDPDR